MPDTLRIVLIFAAAFIGLSVAFFLADVFLGFRTSVNGFIAAISSALICGQVFASRQDRAPSNAEANRHTLLFTLVLVLITALQLSLVSDAAALLSEPAFLWVALAFLAVSVLGMRFFFAFGAKQGLKGRRKAD